MPLLDPYQKVKAKVDAYLAAELPEFESEVCRQAQALEHSLGVEIFVPTNSGQAGVAIAELIAESGEFGLVLDTETAAILDLKEDRPPLILKADGSLATKQHSYAQEAPLDPHRSRIRLVQITGAHRAGGPNRLIVIDANVIPITDPALTPLWRSKLWIHNAAFDAKHLLAAGIDLSHANIIDTMLLAGMVHRCEPNHRLPAPTRPSLAKYAKAAAGINLPKSGQVSDWSRPALSHDQLVYAALDVAVLAVFDPSILGQAAGSTREGLPRASV